MVLKLRIDVTHFPLTAIHTQPTDRPDIDHRLMTYYTVNSEQVRQLPGIMHNWDKIAVKVFYDN